MPTKKTISLPLPLNSVHKYSVVYLNFLVGTDLVVQSTVVDLTNNFAVADLDTEAGNNLQKNIKIKIN